MDVSRGWSELADMVWPRKCCVCGELLEVDECYMCSGCKSDIPFTYFWSWRNNPAERMLWARTYLQGVVSLFYYSRDNGYRHLLHEVKYRGNISLGIYLGRMLGRRIGESYTRPLPDMIVPVPLHWRRQWRRGYNQSEVIAKGIADGMGGCKVVTGLIRRVRYSTSQTRIHVGSKWENVQDAFMLNAGIRTHDYAGRHILLVDDVLTTGATAEACYKILSLLSGVKISYASIAYVAGDE